MNSPTRPERDSGQKPGPLHGVRIVDLSCVLSGPAATMLLADQGADVIKVESFDGDITRRMGEGRDGLTAFFLNINRGKRAIALDLKEPDGLAIVRQLVRGADVFVQNFRPGAIERLGLSEGAVRAERADIVYVSISGFGPTGPYADQRVYDPVIQALSGLADIQSDRDSGRPRMVRTIIPDKTTALTAAQAITAALFARQRDGRGQTVDLAMLDATIAYLWPEGMTALTLVDTPERGGSIAQDLVFRTSDGYITVGAISDGEWAGLCGVLGRREWIEDPRFRTAHDRVVNAPERLAVTAAELEGDTSAAWLDRLRDASVPCAPILRRDEVLDDPQVRANGIVREYTHPGLGRVRQPRPAARFAGFEPSATPHAPTPGAHSAELLAELGYTQAAIDDLVARAIVAC